MSAQTNSPDIAAETASFQPMPNTPRRPRPGPFTMRGAPSRGTLLGLIGLLVLTDVVFWDHETGLSLALYMVVLSAAIIASKTPRATRRQWWLGMGLAVFFNLPLVEQLQVLSVGFSLGWMALLTSWAAFGRLVKWWQTVLGVLTIFAVGFWLLPNDMAQVAKRGGTKADVFRHLSALALPLGVGLLFVWLLVAANPVFDRVLSGLFEIDMLLVDEPRRLAFWFLSACLLWPLLNLGAPWHGRPFAGVQVSSRPSRVRAFFITPQSVRNSLFLFNILFGVQTAMDIGVLTGGVALPEGMTYASYAHRGAYPLVVTALLAGGFAVLTREMVRDDRALRGLMFLWIGQNLFLVLTAGYRLMLYIDAYALTYLRVAAFIWMGLVFVGLVLVVIQIRRELSTGWLLKWNVALLASVLYACAFINFAGVIARYNMTHLDGRALDRAYVCYIGAGAARAVVAFEAETGRAVCPNRDWRLDIQPAQNWRDWGFRTWRLNAYLDQSESE